MCVQVPAKTEFSKGRSSFGPGRTYVGMFKLYFYHVAFTTRCPVTRYTRTVLNTLLLQFAFPSVVEKKQNEAKKAFFLNLPLPRPCRTYTKIREYFTKPCESVPTRKVPLHHTQNEHVRMKEKVAKKWKLLKILLPDSHKVCKDLGGEKPGCCTELSLSRHVGPDRRNVYETAPWNAPSL